MFSASPQERAYVAPFFTFMALLALGELVAKLFEGQAFWVVATPRYWVFPLQTIVCSAVLAAHWRYYEWEAPRRIGLTLLVAGVVFLIWISPQQWGGMPLRMEGFDPRFFGSDGPRYYLHLLLRFARLVVVVPLLEEIFWRGFLLRYLINQDFLRVPFGTLRWGSFSAVTLLFALAHWGPDFWPALVTGALYNLVAWWTRRLSACVLAHAVTNLLLGIYIMRTGQWGFW